MSLRETVQNKMYAAMKAHNKQEKDAYALLLGRLQKKEIDLRRPLTEVEEVQIVSQLVNQCKEGYSEVAKRNTDKVAEKEAFLAKTKAEIELFSTFLPTQMTEEEIKETIKATMQENGMDVLTSKTKGLLMKNLMPKVKGKADGKLVAQLVDSLVVK